MAIANLHEIIQASIVRRAQLQLDISLLQNQKSAAMFSQGEVQSLMASEKSAIRDKFRAEKNYAMSDYIRDELNKLNISISDKKIK